MQKTWGNWIRLFHYKKVKLLPKKKNNLKKVEIAIKQQPLTNFLCLKWQISYNGLINI